MDDFRMACDLLSLYTDNVGFATEIDKRTEEKGKAEVAERFTSFVYGYDDDGGLMLNSPYGDDVQLRHIEPFVDMLRDKLRRYDYDLLDPNNAKKLVELYEKGECYKGALSVILNNLEDDLYKNAYLAWDAEVYIQENTAECAELAEKMGLKVGVEA